MSEGSVGAALPQAPPSARSLHLPGLLAVAGAVALLTGLPAALGPPGWAVAVGALQLALVASWAPATGLPARVGAPVLGLAAAAAADLLLLLPERPDPGVLVAVPAVGVLAAVLHQMVRRSPRQAVVASLAGVVLLLCAVVGLALLLRLEPTGGTAAATTAVLVVGAALAAGHLVDLVLPRPAVAPGVPSGVPALLAAALAGTAVAALRGGSGDLVALLPALAGGLALGSVAALVGLAAGFVAAERRRPAWAGAVVQAVLPVAAAAPVAFSVLLQGAFPGGPG